MSGATTPPTRNVGYVYDPLYLEHDLPGHPENANRVRAIISHLEESGLLKQLARIQPRDASDADLCLVHTPDLIERVRATSGGGQRWLDADTYAGERSYDAALRAVGGLLAATDAVLDAEVDSAFCLVRP